MLPTKTVKKEIHPFFEIELSVFVCLSIYLISSQTLSIEKKNKLVWWFTLGEFKRSFELNWIQTGWIMAFDDELLFKVDSI